MLGLKGFYKNRYFYITYSYFNSSIIYKGATLHQASTISWNPFKKPEVNFKSFVKDSISKINGNNIQIVIDNVIPLSYEQYLNLSRKD